MRNQMETILMRHGQKVTLRSRATGETQEIRAFLQPILKRQEHPPITATPLGAVSTQRWLYLGSSRTAISPGDQVEHGSLCLTVQEAREVFLGERLLYHWALLQRTKEAAV